MIRIVFKGEIDMSLINRINRRQSRLHSYHNENYPHSLSNSTNNAITTTTTNNNAGNNGRSFHWMSAAAAAASSVSNKRSNENNISISTNNNTSNNNPSSQLLFLSSRIPTGDSLNASLSGTSTGLNLFDSGTFIDEHRKARKRRQLPRMKRNLEVLKIDGKSLSKDIPVTNIAWHTLGSKTVDLKSTVGPASSINVKIVRDSKEKIDNGGVETKLPDIDARQQTVENENKPETSKKVIDFSPRPPPRSFSFIVDYKKVLDYMPLANNEPIIFHRAEIIRGECYF